MKVAGVEEAGRGPVIGPLVMAVCTIDNSKQKMLTIEGVTDSKLLTPIKREQLFEKIKELVDDYKIIIVSPTEIDEALNNPNNNLNLLEAQTSAKLLKQVDFEKAILDCPTADTKKYAETVKRLTEKEGEYLAEHKADLNHPIVSAASILAKVTRDKEIEKLQKELGVDFGSGYPSDPKTKEFIEKNFEDPKYENIFRKTWDTYKKLVEKKNQTSLFDY
ncbi:ribonuclease HII [Candidatus Woesearchaeota archaeon]|nr:MAG: ribonuclease HII [Candidatus Woesearchaeota archaeon]